MSGLGSGDAISRLTYEEREARRRDFVQLPRCGVWLLYRGSINSPASLRSASPFCSPKRGGIGLPPERSRDGFRKNFAPTSCPFALRKGWASLSASTRPILRKSIAVHELFDNPPAHRPAHSRCWPPRPLHHRNTTQNHSPSAIFDAFRWTQPLNNVPASLPRRAKIRTRP